MSGHAELSIHCTTPLATGRRSEKASNIAAIAS